MTYFGLLFNALYTKIKFLSLKICDNGSFIIHVFTQTLYFSEAPNTHNILGADSTSISTFYFILLTQLEV
jgi:hypothetical protein